MLAFMFSRLEFWLFVGLNSFILVQSLLPLDPTSLLVDLSTSFLMMTAVWSLSDYYLFLLILRILVIASSDFSRRLLSCGALDLESASSKEFFNFLGLEGALKSRILVYKRVSFKDCLRVRIDIDLGLRVSFPLA